MNQARWRSLFSFVAVSMLIAACSSPAAPASPAAKADPPKAEAPAAKTESNAKPAESAPAGAAPNTSSAGQGWEAEWAKVVEDAKKEKLVIVTHPGSDYQGLMASFKKDFPDIAVEHTGARPSDISPKIITEQQNGVFSWDVMAATTSNMNNVLLPANAYQDIAPFFVRKDVMDDTKWVAESLRCTPRMTRSRSSCTTRFWPASFTSTGTRSVRISSPHLMI